MISTFSTSRTLTSDDRHSHNVNVYYYDVLHYIFFSSLDNAVDRLSHSQLGFHSLSFPLAPSNSRSTTTTMRRQPPRYTITRNGLFFSLLLSSLITHSGKAASGSGEWYHECTDGNCGYGGGGTVVPTSSDCRDDSDECASYARLGK